MKQLSVLVLNLNSALSIGRTLKETLEASFNSVTHLSCDAIESRLAAFDCDAAFQLCSRNRADIVFVVLSQQQHQITTAMLKRLKQSQSRATYIVVVESCKPDELLELLKAGADDFIIPPLRDIDILPRIWRLVEQRREEESLVQSVKEKLGLKMLIGQSPVFLSEIKNIPTIAKCDVSVLISGETGTGKEICARAVHYLSPRANKPFMPINCGAIPNELIENELFGHVKGAYTGASMSQPGLIEETYGGTIFLDEIDCLPQLAQVKLLRFLQEKEYRPLGSTKARKADVRVVAATNVDLQEAVEKGRIRQDLYYRLNIIPIVLPPLRRRREDIPLLASHFLEKFSSIFNKKMTGFSPDAMQSLLLHDWPGNVRELEHVVERAVALSQYDIIRNNDISLPCHESANQQDSFQKAKAKVIKQFEKDYIQNLLLTYKGNITKAAQASQKNRRAFWQLIRKHGIDANKFKTGWS